MAQTDHKRSTMTIYMEDRYDSRTHWILITLAEKGIQPNISIVNQKKMPPELASINPYGILPLLVERELVLYRAGIIAEYLDERFPHPPLLPVYPVTRAKSRQMIYQIEQDWYALLSQIERDVTQAKPATQLLQKSLLGLAPLFATKPYFLHDEFTLIDCCIAPVLWRLKQLNINIVNTAKEIIAYQSRIFERAGFLASLSEFKRVKD